MSFDVRLISTVSGFEGAVESFDRSKNRYLLCSRDYARSADGSSLIATAVPAEGKEVMASFPAKNALDGNRLTSMRTGEACEWVQLTIDTRNSLRKSLFWLEYFEDEEIEPFLVEMSADNVIWNTITVEALFRGRKFSLWQLPWNAESSSGEVSILVVNGGGTSYDVSGTYTTNQLVGYHILPLSGMNAGQVRRVIGQTGTTSPTLVLDSAFAVPLTVGLTCTLRKFVPAFLEYPYIRFKLRNRWHSSKGPIRLVSLSVFDWFLELKGDKSNFRSTRAGNPTGVQRSTRLGVAHRGLTGAVQKEDRLGPKRKMAISWQVSPAIFYDYLEEFNGLGTVGLVDEDCRYMQGILEGDLTGDRLSKAINAGEENSLRVSFEEI